MTRKYHPSPGVKKDSNPAYCGTFYAAESLGLSVASIHKLVENNEIYAWKTNDYKAMASGMEALIEISSFRPDALITDLRMPGLDGFELLRIIRQDLKFDMMIILFLTALTDKDILNQGGLPEGRILTHKPINREWLKGFFTGIKMANFDIEN